MNNQAKKLIQSDKENNRSNKAKAKKKDRSEICRYLWFNEYYADRQNRLQKEHLQVYLKHLQKEKVNMLVNYYREQGELIEDRKRCMTSTGFIRENYEQILKSRNNAALDSYLQYLSVGSQNTAADAQKNREQLQEKLNKSVKMHKFKKHPAATEKKSFIKENIKKVTQSKFLKNLCSDGDEDESGGGIIDSDDNDGVDYLKDSDGLDDYEKKILNYNDKKDYLVKTRRSSSGPLEQNKQKAKREKSSGSKTRKPSKSATSHSRPSIDVDNLLYETKVAKVRIVELMNKRLATTNTIVDAKKRVQSAMVSVSSNNNNRSKAKSPTRNSIANPDYTFAKFPNEILEYQYLSTLEKKERLIAAKPDKTVLKVKMNRDPIFAKRYKQFSMLRKSGPTMEYDTRDSFIAPVKMSQKQLERERVKIVEAYGKKYEQYSHHKKTDEKYLREKIDAFLSTINKNKFI